jgi:tight adherence protein B
MKWGIMLLFACSSFLLCLAMLQVLFLSNRTVNKRIRKYLDLNDKRKLNRKRFNLLVQMQLYKRTVREKVLTKQKNDKLAALLQRAGLPIQPEEYIIFQWLSAAFGGFLFSLSGGFLLFLPGAVLGYMLPRWFVVRKEKQRIAKFNDGLEDMITTVIGSLRAGFSFVQALKAVSEESQSPIREEIELLLKEIQYGTSMEEALLHLKERMPSGDLELLIQAVLIQRQVGGNLAVVLETIVRTIRDRNRIQRQVQTLTAQGRLSGIVIGCLPVALGIIIYMMEPHYIGTLFRHPIGMGLMAAGTISGIIGFIMIRKMTTIEV